MSEFLVLTVGPLLLLLLLIYAMPILADMAVFDTATQNAISSTETGLNEMLPIFMIMLTGGGIVLALRSR